MVLMMSYHFALRVLVSSYREPYIQLIWKVEGVLWLLASVWSPLTSIWPHPSLMVLWDYIVTYTRFTTWSATVSLIHENSVLQNESKMIIKQQKLKADHKQWLIRSKKPSGWVGFLGTQPITIWSSFFPPLLNINHFDKVKKERAIWRWHKILFIFFNLKCKVKLSGMRQES